MLYLALEAAHMQQTTIKKLLLLRLKLSLRERHYVTRSKLCLFPEPGQRGRQPLPGYKPTTFRYFETYLFTGLLGKMLLFHPACPNGFWMALVFLLLFLFLCEREKETTKETEKKQFWMASTAAGGGW
jgi:hypothetical protein